MPQTLRIDSGTSNYLLQNQKKLVMKIKQIELNIYSRHSLSLNSIVTNKGSRKE